MITAGRRGSSSYIKQTVEVFMKTCKKFEEKLLLYIYNEIDDDDRAELEAHLQVCPDCRSELQNHKAMQQIIPQNPLIEPDEATLKVLRNAVSHKIRARTMLKTTKSGKPFIFSFVKPSPVFQIGFAVLLLTFGFLLGRQTISGVNKEQQGIQNLLTANRGIQAAKSTTNPLLAGVEKIKYNSQTGSVEIYYTTINDVQVQGNLDNPAVEHVLQQAMMDENNPAIRLHAVKALQVLAENGQSIKPELVSTVDRALEKEQNLGVRLQTLRLLKLMPLSQAVKGILTKILLYDPEPAVRIEAFEILTGKKLSQQDLETIVEAAKKDSNSYINFRSNEIIDQIKKSDTEQSEPMKLMRKEKP